MKLAWLIEIDKIIMTDLFCDVPVKSKKYFIQKYTSYQVSEVSLSI